jgi:hypothetical protein
MKKTQTRKFAIDAGGLRIFVGSPVNYKNSTYLVEDMKYLRWSNKHYLTLVDSQNKNKKVDFVSSTEVKKVYRGKNG